MAVISSERPTGNHVDPGERDGRPNSAPEGCPTTPNFRNESSPASAGLFFFGGLYLICVAAIMWPTQAFVELGGGNMSRMTALFVGVAALTVISTVAEAEDGCGRGWYYNGRRCVPMDAPMYRRDYGPPQYRGDYGPPVDRGPGLRLDLGGRRDEARYSPPNPAFKTWNNCPPNFTVQDGLCKPYRGR